jgi:hypothetical protein
MALFKAATELVEAMESGKLVSARRLAAAVNALL